MKGFTLIELLVSITIIVVLYTIGLVVYSSVAKQGRDSKRQSDLRSIQSALEQYFFDQLFYPSNNVPNRSMDIRLRDGGELNSYIGSPSTPPSRKIYMNSVPRDSISTTPYRYSTIPVSCTNATTNRCTSYCLYAKLENPPSPALSLPTGCTWPVVNGGTYNFVVTPP